MFRLLITHPWDSLVRPWDFLMYIDCMLCSADPFARAVCLKYMAVLCLKYT